MVIEISDSCEVFEEIDYSTNDEEIDDVVDSDGNSDTITAGEGSEDEGGSGGGGARGVAM